MTLLQASAGTGKTFTIAALTTRYVAEGILPIDRLLVITFTRMATGELRERVRERLVRTFDGLVDVLDGARRARRRRVGAAPGGGAGRGGGDPARPVGQGHRQLRRGDHRDDARILPPSPLWARYRRGRGPGGDARRGRERPHGRGRRRSLLAQVRHPDQLAEVHSCRGHGDRTARARSPRRGVGAAPVPTAGHAGPAPALRPSCARGHGTRASAPARS